MLSIGAMASGQAQYYLDLAREDYYLDGGEPPGRWWGKGAESLGLTDTVGRDELQTVFDGFLVDAGALVKNAGSEKRQPGWDLTFSAPKSVSVLWSQADAETRQVIQAAQAAAVEAALSYLEDVASFSRRGHGGTERVSAGLVVATFEHGTSRALDPQLHTHCLVMNVSVDSDGHTATLVSKPLYRHKMTAGAIYRAQLAYLLQADLDLIPDRKRTWFELRGVPEKLIRLFSKRRSVIEEKLSSRGLESASAAAFATLSTRDVKTLVPPRGELFSGWQRDGNEHAFSPADMPRETLRDQDREKGVSEAIREAVETITKDDSHFGEKDLLRRAAEASQGRGLDAAFIRTSVRDALDDDRSFVQLGELAGEVRYTTREMLALEKRLLELTELTKGRRVHVCEPNVVEDIIVRNTSERSTSLEEAKHHARQFLRAARRRRTSRVDRDTIRRHAKQTLSPEQADAVLYLTTTPGSIKVLGGLAGTGKTTTLRVCREVWEKAGYTVIGTALAGRAAKGLQDGAGIKSTSLETLFLRMNPSLKYQVKHHAKQLARQLRHKRTYSPRLKINKKTVLVLDEAGMVGTRQMAALIYAVQKGGGKLVLAGDPKQLQPIEAGGPLSAIAKRLGHFELETISRQQNADDRQVVRAFSAGKAVSALQDLAERGLVTVSESRRRAIEALVYDWSSSHASSPEKGLIFCGTNTEADDVNKRCQTERSLLGKLDPLSRLRFEDGYLFKGDRVLFTKNSRTLGVHNGEIGTIVAVHEKRARIAVKLDDGDRVIIPLKTYKHDRGPAKGKSAVRLGYAVTTHKGQGTTVDNAYVLAGGSMQHREISYVQASRARNETRIYTDRNEAGEELTNLARQMSKSRAKNLAHDVLAENRPEQAASLRISRDL